MELQKFEFKGEHIRVSQEADGEAWFVLKDLCTALEIGNPRQVRARLNPDGVSQTDVIDSMGRKQSATVVDEGGMYEVILRSDKPEAKDFRRWVTREVLPAIRKNGGYINPRASEHQINALMFQCRSQMELAQAAKGLIHDDFLEAKARLILARGMGEAPELDPATRPLYVQDFLKEKGLSKKQLSAKASGFGKRMKNAWAKVHGVPPKRSPIELTNGRIIDVYAYTEADRPLMEEVWAKHYAPGLAAVV